MSKEIRMPFEEYEALNKKCAEVEKTLLKYQENYKHIDLLKPKDTVNKHNASIVGLGVYIPPRFSSHEYYHRSSFSNEPIYYSDHIRTDSELVLIVEEKHTKLMEQANDKIKTLQERYDEQIDLNLKITEDRDFIKEKLDKTIYETSKRWSNRFKFWK